MEAVLQNKSIVTALPSSTSEDRFLSLIEDHKGIIFKVANSYCRGAEDRKDLIQEIVVHLWKAHGRYDARFKFSSWLYRIALNVAISAYRREKKRSDRITSLEEVIIEPAEEIAMPDPRIDALNRAIAQLDELSRALIILYLDDNSYREIAAILGITETNVATKINRLKGQIRKQLSVTPL